MLFSLTCLAIFMAVICAPGLIAQARAEHNASPESEAH